MLVLARREFYEDKGHVLYNGQEIVVLSFQLASPCRLEHQVWLEETLEQN